MQEERIKYFNLELKIIKLDLERIKLKLEDNNRSIKEILQNADVKSKKKELKELIEFNRFLLQKHKEKIGDKLKTEGLLKKLILEENKNEHKVIESEKRTEHLMLTIDKNLAFNADHPFYEDIDFIKDLLKEFLKREDYETCALLKNRLEELSNLSLT